MLKINQKIKLFIISLFACYSFSSADVALDLNLGSLFLTKTGKANLDFDGRIWYKFDQMVFVGIGSGVQKYDNHLSYPLLASLLLRLPIGGQVLPITTADWGYAVGYNNYFLWRVGLGADIKAGDNSSIMIFGGFQNNTPLDSPAIYARAGVLLEF